MAKDVRRDIANRDLGRALGRRIARLERHLREVETASQAAFRSVEDGALDFYDDDGVLRERIGKQTDGSWGRVVKEGPIPPAPTEPDVQVISDGVVAITWDGRTEEKWPIAEFRMVRVHLGDTEDFTPDRDNQVGAIWAARGGTIVAVTESDDDNPVWVKLAAVSTAGHWTESDAVLVDELDEDDLEEEPEELSWEDGDGHTLTAADIAAGTVTFGLSHIPEQESLLAWWHPGGLDYAGEEQDPSQSSIDFEAGTVTWPLSGFEKAGDRLRVYYAYWGGPETALAAQLVAATSGNSETPTMPAGVQDGDLVVISAAVPGAGGVSVANGYTTSVDTASVTHAAHFGTYTYRLMVLTRVLSGGTAPVPTITGGSDVVWVVTVWRGPGAVLAEAHRTLADAKTAATPALVSADIRCWVALGNMPAISLTDLGTVAASRNTGSDVTILVAVDAGEGEVDAETAATSAGWMTATLALEGSA